MSDFFEKIKKIAPQVIYLRGKDEFIPCPPDADTTSMIFVEMGDCVAGFTRLTDGERASVSALLQEKPTAIISQNTAIKARIWDELKVEEKDALLKELLESQGWLKDGKVV